MQCLPPMGPSSMATDTSSLTSAASPMNTSGPFPITTSPTPIMTTDHTSLLLYQPRSMLLVLGYRRLFFQTQTILIINLLFVRILFFSDLL